MTIPVYPLYTKETLNPDTSNSASDPITPDLREVKTSTHIALYHEVN